MAESHSIVSDERPSEGARAEDMRNACEQALAKRPLSLIVIYELDGHVGVATVGAPRDLIPLYHAGGDTLAALMRGVLEKRNECG